MSNTANFDHHINVTIESARQLSAWILRTFKSREPKVMITLWKSLVVPKLEYCSQLWSPFKTGEIQRLEIVQWTYLRKIKDLHHSDYWECLKKFKLYSLQRQRERYQIIYVWKILEDLVPNIDDKNNTGLVNNLNSARLGRRCYIPTIKSQGMIKSMRYCTII